MKGKCFCPDLRDIQCIGNHKTVCRFKIEGWGRKGISKQLRNRESTMTQCISFLKYFNNCFKQMGFWGFGEIGRASCRERVYSGV